MPQSSVIYIKDLYISGVLDGRLTILVEGNIYITRRDPTDYNYNNAKYTGGIEYANTNIPTLTENPIDPSDDMLGLVSNGNIYVHSYGWPKWGKHGRGLKKEILIHLIGIQVVQRTLLFMRLYLAILQKVVMESRTIIIWGIWEEYILPVPRFLVKWGQLILPVEVEFMVIRKIILLI